MPNDYGPRSSTPTTRSRSDEFPTDFAAWSSLAVVAGPYMVV